MIPGAQKLPINVGKEILIGRTVTALTRIDSRDGRIFVEGECWNAINDAPIGKGKEAEIAAVNGLTVKLPRKLIETINKSDESPASISRRENRGLNQKRTSGIQ